MFGFGVSKREAHFENLIIQTFADSARTFSVQIKEAYRQFEVPYAISQQSEAILYATWLHYVAIQNIGLDMKSVIKIMHKLADATAKYLDLVISNAVSNGEMEANQAQRLFSSTMESVEDRFRFYDDAFNRGKAISFNNRASDADTMVPLYEAFTNKLCAECESHRILLLTRYGFESICPLLVQYQMLVFRMAQIP